MKVLAWIAVAALCFGLGWYVSEHKDSLSSLLPQKETTEESEEITKENDTEICAQVITPAINPETKEIREFPTPCDVPEGWDPIQNDIPGLELEVQ